MDASSVRTGAPGERADVARARHRSGPADPRRCDSATMGSEQVAPTLVILACPISAARSGRYRQKVCSGEVGDPVVLCAGDAFWRAGAESASTRAHGHGPR